MSGCNSFIQRGKPPCWYLPGNQDSAFLGSWLQLEWASSRFWFCRFSSTFHCSFRILHPKFTFQIKHCIICSEHICSPDLFGRNSHESTPQAQVTIKHGIFIYHKNSYPLQWVKEKISWTHLFHQWHKTVAVTNSMSLYIWNFFEYWTWRNCKSLKIISSLSFF